MTEPADRNSEPSMGSTLHSKIHIHERKEKRLPGDILTRDLYHDSQRPLWIVQTNQRTSHSTKVSDARQVLNQKGGEASILQQRAHAQQSFLRLKKEVQTSKTRLQENAD
jgi:hypothetical protein